MEGYEFTPEGQCFDLAGGPTVDSVPNMFGDKDIPDHLKCYDIIDNNPFFNDFIRDVIYAGQFQEHLFNIDLEDEICLFATKIHVPEIPPTNGDTGGTPVGGSFIPIDSSALLLLAAQTTASWIIPVLVSAVGIGIVLARKISSNKE